MAKLLINMTDNGDLEKYDILAVVESSHVFGSGESLDPPTMGGKKGNPLLVVEINGKTRKELKHLKGPLFKGNTFTPDSKFEVIKSCSHQFNYDTKGMSKSLVQIQASDDWLIPEVNVSDVEDKT